MSRNRKSALASVAQWIECRPVNQRVVGSIPSQGTCLGCRLGPQLGEHERLPHMDVSLPLFLPPFPFVGKMESVRLPHLDVQGKKT